MSALDGILRAVRHRDYAGAASAARCLGDALRAETKRAADDVWAKTRAGGKDAVQCRSDDLDTVQRRAAEKLRRTRRHLALGVEHTGLDRRRGLALAGWLAALVDDPTRTDARLSETGAPQWYRRGDWLKTADSDRDWCVHNVLSPDFEPITLIPGQLFRPGRRGRRCADRCSNRLVSTGRRSRAGRICRGR